MIASLKEKLALVAPNDNVYRPIENPLIRSVDDSEHFIAGIPVPRSISDERLVLRYELPNKIVRWNISEIIGIGGYRSYFESPPRISVDNISVPESATSGSVSVSVSVSESSSTEWGGQEPFNIGISSTAISGSPVYTIPLSSGETRTRDFDVSLYKDTGTEDILFDWGASQETKTVEHR